MTRKPIIAKSPQALSTTSAASTSDRFEFVVADPGAAPVDLIELRLWPPRQGERTDQFPIWPEVRIAEETIITESWRITVYLNRAELAAIFNDCGVAPGTRYGDTPLPSDVRKTETEISERSVSVSSQLLSALSGKLGLATALSARAEAKADKRTQVRSKKATEQKLEVVQRRVSALPNDRWEIVEPRGRLRGSYLVAPSDDVMTEKPLCLVSADADMFSIALSIEVRPNDMEIEITRLVGRWVARERPNKEAIAKLLVKKACTERFGRSGDERVTLARAVLEGAAKARHSLSPA